MTSNVFYSVIQLRIYAYVVGLFVCCRKPVLKEYVRTYPFLRYSFGYCRISFQDDRVRGLLHTSMLTAGGLEPVVILSLKHQRNPLKICVIPDKEKDR